MRCTCNTFKFNVEIKENVWCGLFFATAQHLSTSHAYMVYAIGYFLMKSNVRGGDL